MTDRLVCEPLQYGKVVVVLRSDTQVYQVVDLLAEPKTVQEWQKYVTRVVEASGLDDLRGALSAAAEDITPESFAFARVALVALVHGYELGASSWRERL